MTASRLKARPVKLLRGARGRTLPQLLRDNAAEMGDTVAIRSKRAGLWRSTSWKALFETVLRTSAALDALGLQKGEVICLISENREESWIVQMAAISLGAVAVNVYPDAPSEEVAFALEHSRAVFALGEDQEQVDKILSCEGGAPRLKRILFVEPNGLWDYHEKRLVSLAKAQEEALKTDLVRQRLSERAGRRAAR